MSETFRIKEYDGAREVEMEVQGEVVYIDSARSCYAFDRALFLRSIERAFGVVMFDLTSLTDPRGDSLSDYSVSAQG